jgi:VWFA-related protein
MVKSAVTAVALAVAGASWATPQEPIARTQAEIVRLDVVVTDEDGNLVRGLTEKDFALSEDGKAQTLTHFAAVGGAAGAEPGAAGGGSGATGGQHFVILVDDVHIAHGDLLTVKEALKEAADALLENDNKVALLTVTAPPAPYRFEEDWPSLRRAVDALEASDIVPPVLSSDMTPATAEMILRGDRSALVLASRRLIDDPTTIIDTTGPRAAMTGATGPTPAGLDPSEKVAAEEAQRSARSVLTQALRFSSLTLTRLEGVVRGLAALPGRKVVLLVSDGFLVGQDTGLKLRRDLEGIVDAATRSGSVVYTLDSEGLPVTVSDAGVAGVPSRPGLQQTVARHGEILFRKTLEAIAASTGGSLIRGTEGFTSGLERMLDENAAHYVLAYTPTNTKHDGKFRKIEVKLPGQGDYIVRTRRGYLAPSDREDDTTVRMTTLSDEAVWALLDAPPSTSGIPLALTSGFVDRPPLGSQVLIRANVDLKEIAFREKDSHHYGSVELLGAVYDAEGHPVGAPFRRVAQLDWSDAERKEGLAHGLPWEESVTLGPGRYQIRLLARDAITAREGLARQWVDVPDLANHQLAMSAVFLGSEEQMARGVRRFKRSEDLAFQLYVYNPLVDASGKSDVVMQAQIWAGGKTVAASHPEPVVFDEADGTRALMTNSFPLASLDPGPYEFRVVAVDRKASLTVTRTTDFTVE